ncbi:HNH endonuclease signature motif containing protein [Clostridium celatum]|uniref:HNH endonuclease signature motif containing protein n=1 Tax=Clostridium celatum TaxID=36834 RepID=UPI0028FED8EF|nr:HNH endonuclease signature motif containing protein [Clostridium celatum]MDU2265242.1 HNH endonuclease signature motif containing protein [Clostridium celatum]MDU6295968.1 HNH endonuclease signature motif containing protein [Clostridium celatum]
MCPMKPMKPCKYLGCPNLTEDKYCNEHKEFNVKERETATERGYDSKWRTARSRFLKVNPLCVRCKDEGRLVKATVVDHIKPHREDKKLFWDESNWQALCKRCHDKKTMTEDRYKEYKY